MADPRNRVKAESAWMWKQAQVTGRVKGTRSRFFALKGNHLSLWVILFT